MKSREGRNIPLRRLRDAAIVGAGLSLGVPAIVGVVDTVITARQKSEAQHSKGTKGADSALNPDRELLEGMLKKEGLRDDVRVMKAQLEFMRSLLESKDGITKISGDASGEKLMRLFNEKVANADKTAMSEDIKMSTRNAILSWFYGYKKRRGNFTEGSLRKDIAREVSMLGERIDKKQSGIPMSPPNKLGK